MPTERETLIARSRTTNARVANVTLTVAGSGQLIGTCVEPINLSAKVTGRIGPAVGSIGQYARDEALS
jgi:hypothetical protein